MVIKLRCPQVRFVRSDCLTRSQKKISPRPATTSRITLVRVASHEVKHEE